MPPKYTMSDSESEAEGEVPGTPSDQVLERGLRDQVASIFKSGNMEELTVKRVRLAAEDRLGLTAGYFKSTGDWKVRSERIIKDEVETQDQAMQNPQSQASEKPISPPPKPKPTALAKRAKSETAPKPRKRQKTQTPVSDEDVERSAPSSDESDDVKKPKSRSKAPTKKSPAKKVSVRKTKKAISDVSDFSGDESDDATEAKKQLKAPVKQSPGKKPSRKPTDDASEASDIPDDTSNPAKLTKDTKDDSESEMSVVFDEEPQPKAPRKRQKSAGGTATKTKKAPKAKEEDISPDQAEIKRLQGWLIKCGIRKLWGKELAPYDTPKAKIKHLKGMLEDAGMTGRPSQEKANHIREERELKADLEQIQQGAKQWGAKSDEDNDEDTKPRRRVVSRGRQSLAFLESDGEETD
ncbi:unnamed protein product [Penicillium glandicola]